MQVHVLRKIVPFVKVTGIGSKKTKTMVMVKIMKVMMGMMSVIKRTVKRTKKG